VRIRVPNGYYEINLSAFSRMMSFAEKYFVDFWLLSRTASI
jgi:hypothetical protein